jgi:hypothetical protein
LIQGRWDPKTLPQRLALNSAADILCYGGAAGGGKSEVALLDAAKERQKRNSHAIIFRRTVPELADLIERSRSIYSNMGAVFNEQQKLWRFPGGSRVRFAGIEYEKDKYKFQGSQFSALEFDESTHFPESMISYLWTRARSTDPYLRVRMRLYTNPGGEGHSFHKDLFLNGVCPHCDPENGPEPAKVYFDKVWPGSKRPIGAGVAFIPATLRDHELFGPGNKEYIARLHGQDPAIADALIMGCWNAFEGQYFSIWDKRVHTCLREQVLTERWWPYWTGTDYGFGGSWACSYLLTRSPATSEFPNGRVYILDEVAESKMYADKYSQKLVDRWILNDSGKRREEEISPWYMGKDCWNQKGDGHTLAGQMMPALEPYEYSYSKASDDREGGAQLIFKMLSTRELVICRDTCKLLCESIPSRLHDPDFPRKVFKVKNNRLDDAYDGARYGIYSFFQQGQRPIAEQIAERIKDMDPVNQMIVRRKMEAEIPEHDGLQVTGGQAARRGQPQAKRRAPGVL